MFDPRILAMKLGFAFLGTHDAGIIERWQVRDPGSMEVPPWHILTPIGDERHAEFTRTVDGKTECQWVQAITGACAPCTIAIALDEGAQIERLQAAIYPPMVQTNLYNVVWNPCDINCDGVFNVYDFIAFLNNPYDWDGDGNLTVFDFNAFLNGCGG